MGFWSVLAAAAAAFVAAGVWYMALGRRWMAATGRSEAEIRGSRSALPFVLSFVGYCLTAGMLRHILVGSGVSGAGAGLVAGLGLGLFVAAPFVVTNYAYAARPSDLWWIDGGHPVLACTVMGLVLGIFG